MAFVDPAAIKPLRVVVDAGTEWPGRWWGQS